MGDLLYANQTNCKREAKEGVRETVFLKRVWAAANVYSNAENSIS